MRERADGDSFVFRDDDTGLAFDAPSAMDSGQHINGAGQEFDLLLEESFLREFLLEDEGNIGAEACPGSDAAATAAPRQASGQSREGMGQYHLGHPPLVGSELYQPLAAEERTSSLGVEAAVMSGSNEHIEMTEKAHSVGSESENWQATKREEAATGGQTASHGNGSEVDGPIASGTKRQRAQLGEKLKESRVNSSSDLTRIDTDTATDGDPDSKAKKEKRLEKNRASAALSRERKRIRMDRLELQVKHLQSENSRLTYMISTLWAENMRFRNENMNLKFSKELNKSEMDDSQESSGSDCDGKNEQPAALLSTLPWSALRSLPIIFLALIISAVAPLPTVTPIVQLPQSSRDHSNSRSGPPTSHSPSSGDDSVEAQVIRKRKGKWRAAGYEGQPDRLHVLNTPGDSHSIAVACRRTLLDPSDEFRICTVGVC